ncbi:MAG: glycosyltransferase family 4 protein [Burkholderiales bacterium]
MIYPALRILHVVRRYGPVGGMERYVWELSHELHGMGQHITIICEQCLETPTAGIQVIALGTVRPKPRWLALLRFGARVQTWLKQHKAGFDLIHSHERTAVHHVTTFHAPPFANVLKKPFWKRWSVRVKMQLYLEKRELQTARCIIPNSTFIARELAHYYPSQAEKMTSPIAPGVQAVSARPFSAVTKEGGIVGFVGKEWKRKGLPLAVEIVSELKKKRPLLQFIVIGPDKKDIASVLQALGDSAHSAGWQAQPDYSHFDVLLHPASHEPYGMVIAEAMAAGVAVVISDQCGAAAHVQTGAGSVLPLSAPLPLWVQALEQALTRNTPVPEFSRPWQQVALEHLTLYRAMLRSGTDQAPAPL